MVSSEKEVFFHTELVKYGIDYQRAAKVAKILVSEMSDEFLTDEEIRLAEEVCQEWLRKHQRLTYINQLISRNGSMNARKMRK
ncbi:hypothetical protein ACF3DV_30840 [Chlorogloeopsis fritschii PCC 9212]|uniref:Uncharacterized protein n=1 Tax=Chlorogloeopsis fritschii PCC 6912 TaxID=211165 RepID=A0A433NMK3_CHLFR|nr:hypothetical protein [Chlorogloeopsis fritschii]RUR84292.1 hypothetical protein PCC6912_18860 [Chlorogloeopsis fritschii PCC 6912]